MVSVNTIKFKNNTLYLIDQRKLPRELSIFECKNFKDVEFAIKDMVMRRAPAIGVTGAYGIVLAAREFMDFTKTKFFSKMQESVETLENSRPTAVNLTWAIGRMKSILTKSKEKPNEKIYEILLDEAKTMEKEDLETNKAIGKYGNEIIPQNATILTHCNTGALATVGYGTALGVIREAHYSGKDIKVFANETRPRLQGARLTAWELVQEEFPLHLLQTVLHRY